MVSPVAAPVCVPTGSAQGSPFSTSCQHVLSGGHSDECVLVSRCGFVCISLMTGGAGRLFTGCWPSVPFGKMLRPLPMFNRVLFLILRCANSLYILDSNLLLDV